MAKSDLPNVPVPTQPATQVPMSIAIGQNTQIDLSWMPEDQRRALLTDYTKGVLDVSKRANELGVEVSVLRNTLGALGETTKQVAQDGNSVTLTHVQNSQFGRTEVIMGNTDAATSGKLSRSQTGERDWTPYYVLGGIVALVVIAIAFSS